MIEIHNPIVEEFNFPIVKSISDSIQAFIYKIINFFDDFSHPFDNEIVDLVASIRGVESLYLQPMNLSISYETEEYYNYSDFIMIAQHEKMMELWDNEFDEDWDDV